MPIPAQIHDRRHRVDRRRADPHPVAEALGHAMTDDCVSMVFQPQFRVKDNSIVGAEALIRWDHPDHGVLPGDALVSIAQNGGLGRRLSRYVVRGALETAKRWPAHLGLSLNVTAMDLHDRTFGDDLLAMIKDTGFSPERLTLEITEQALVNDLEESALRLRGLAGQGIRLALDDFGAGFCNFRYLKLLPLNALKLDRSMVEGIATDPRDLAVLRGILAMAHALKLTVVAEGVETEEVRYLAEREGCDIWQGFLGAKPMRTEEFEALVSN